MELRLKRHETFSIREGWIEKAIHYINENEKCFSKENGAAVFGLGTNMVKSLRYWVSAMNLVTFKKGNAYLTELGKLLLEFDPFLEDSFSLWLLHLYLVTNNIDSPVFNAIFNLGSTQFDKDLLLEKVPNKLADYGYDAITSMASLESDISIFIKSYCYEEFTNPENNMNCPLSRLGMFSSEERKVYSRKTPSFKKLDYRIIYLCLIKCLDINKKAFSFNIEDIYDRRNNPINIFNLNKSLLFSYLEEMRKRGLIKLNKTAGLNVVYIDEPVSLREIISSYYKGE